MLRRLRRPSESLFLGLSGPASPIHLPTTVARTDPQGDHPHETPPHYLPSHAFTITAFRLGVLAVKCRLHAQPFRQRCLRSPLHGLPLRILPDVIIQHARVEPLEGHRRAHATDAAILTALALPWTIIAVDTKTRLR